MKYNPELHNRQTIRLRGYNYSKDGFYFITLCCKDMEQMFGVVENELMILNDAGLIIKKWYKELENKFENINLHEMVVMPNHIHFIVEIESKHNIIDSDDIGSPKQTISRLVQWFKTMTTNEYIVGIKTKKWKPFRRKLWQRNYYEHIIKNYDSFIKISKYIINNPKN